MSGFLLYITISLKRGKVLKKMFKNEIYLTFFYIDIHYNKPQLNFNLTY